MNLPSIDRQQDVVAFLRYWRRPLNQLLQKKLKLPAPYNFRASAPAATASSILLEWTSDDRADGYEIQRSDSGDFNSGYVTIAVDDGSQEALLDNVGAAAVTKYYRILATTGTVGAPHTTRGQESAVISATSNSGTSTYDDGTTDEWRERCVALGTEIEPLGDSSYSTEEHDETHWIEIWTANGFKLRGSTNHPVFTVHGGKTKLIEVNVGDKVITKLGESPVTCHFHILTKDRELSDVRGGWMARWAAKLKYLLCKWLRSRDYQDRKVSVHMARGHLFWANGILSHNRKLPEE